MKSNHLLTILALVTSSFLFTSCEKTYKCTCTINDIELKSSNIKTKNKKDATDKCESLKVHTNEVCKLK